MAARPITIIVPAFNQLACCRQCVESVCRHTAGRPYRLILVDNGSTDGVGEYFESVPGAVVVHSETNLGFAAGVNPKFQGRTHSNPLSCSVMGRFSL